MTKQDDTACAVLCRKAGVSLSGTAGYKPVQLVMELAEPWAKVYGACADFPASLNQVFKQAARQGKVVNFNGIAPDPLYSKAGWRWLFFLELEPSTLRYQMRKFHAPEEHVVGLCTHLLSAAAQDGMPDLYAPFVRLGSEREVLVCGHGSRDHCCGRWGAELHAALRERPELREHGVRVWRSTHIGGHKFAPTLFELPAMRWWGQLNLEAATQILSRQGDITQVLAHYRGFAGLAESYEQVAEQLGLVHEGWAWLEAEGIAVSKALSDEAATGRWQVSLSYRLRAGEQPRHLRAEVAAQGFIESLGSCGDHEVKPSRVYALSELRD